MTPLRFFFGLMALLSAALPARAQDGLTTTAAPCVGGNAGGFACNQVDLQARLPLSSLGPGSAFSASEVWGWTDPETEREYALIGLTDGLGIVDVTDPEAPDVVGKLESAVDDPFGGIWRSSRVYADHVFVGSESDGHGVQVFDLTRVRGVTGAPVTFEADARYTGVSNTHTLVINEATGFLYVAGSTGSNSEGCSGGGLHIVDVREPLDPTFAGCFDDLGYVHEAHCLVYDGPDADYTGRELCVTYNGSSGSVSFVDVSDPANASEISSVSYPDFGYTHQGWFTADKRHILVDDEFDDANPGTRTIVLDVEDLDNPSFSFNFFGPTRTTAHNIYVVGDYAYGSSYEGGLRILDVSGVDEQEIAEVAFFDTYPSSNGFGYDGQWMNYPFFASGNVLASDASNGLFVLRPNIPSVAVEPGAPGAAFALSEALPNPSGGRTELTLTVGQPQHVRASVFDALGRRVAALFDGAVAGGATQRLSFEGGALPPGLYVVHVTGETFTAVRRVTLAR